MNIFCFGGCDLYHSLATMPNYPGWQFANHRYSSSPNLNFEKTRWPNYVSTSLMSLYTQPGILAARIFEDLSDTRNQLTNRENIVYQEVCKWPYLKFFAKFAGPTDVLVLNFSSELYTKYLQEKECVTLIPQINELSWEPNGRVAWFHKLVSNQLFQKSFDEDSVLGLTIELVKDFARDLEPIFGNRVILVDTILTELAVVNNSIQQSVLNVNSIPFYKTTKVMADPTDVSHVRRLLKMATRGFQRSYKHTIPFVTMDPSECFMTPDLNPLHLSNETKNKISQRIFEELLKIQEANLKKNINI
jgi:hypothetical protein